MLLLGSSASSMDQKNDTRSLFDRTSPALIFEAGLIRMRISKRIETRLERRIINASNNISSCLDEKGRRSWDGSRCLERMYAAWWKKKMKEKKGIRVPSEREEGEREEERDGQIDREREREKGKAVYLRARMRLKCTRLISSLYPSLHKITKRVINQISLYFDVIRSNFN